MCDYHTWFYNNESGFVTECRHCSNIKVGFGNILLTFEKPSFEKFRHSIQSGVENFEGSSDKQLKSFVLSTNCKEVNMLLSRTELEGLRDMIEYADNEMKAAGLLKLFE